MLSNDVRSHAYTSRIDFKTASTVMHCSCIEPASASSKRSAAWRNLETAARQRFPRQLKACCVERFLRGFTLGCPTVSGAFCPVVTFSEFVPFEPSFGRSCGRLLSSPPAPPYLSLLSISLFVGPSARAPL
jgi:hypothetical protein